MGPLLLKKIRGRKLQKKNTHTPKQKTTILFLLRDKLYYLTVRNHTSLITFFFLCLSKRSHWGIPIDTVTLYYHTLFILCIYTTPKACSKFFYFIHTLLTQNCFLVESQFFTTNATFLNFFFHLFFLLTIKSHTFLMCACVIKKKTQ